jgi:hypothetical protein
VGAAVVDDCDVIGGGALLGGKAINGGAADDELGVSDETLVPEPIPNGRLVMPPVSVGLALLTGMVEAPALFTLTGV